MALPKHLKRIEEKVDRILSILGEDGSEGVNWNSDAQLIYAGAETEGEALVDDSKPEGGEDDAKPKDDPALEGGEEGDQEGDQDGAEDDKPKGGRGRKKS